MLYSCSSVKYLKTLLLVKTYLLYNNNNNESKNTNVVSSQSSVLFYGFFNTFTVLSSNMLIQSNILTSGTELREENYVSLKSVL